MTPKTDADAPSRVCLVAKYWEPGTVKTRLGAHVGMPVSAALHQLFVKHLTKRVDADLFRQLAGSSVDGEQTTCQSQKSKVLEQIWAIAPSDAIGKVKAEVPGWDICVQGDGDLGDRLQKLFQDHLSPSQQSPRLPARMLVIGGDCPDLPVAILAEAIDKLQTNDAVLGPASDGGYYLLGLKGPWQDWMEDLFQRVPWSQSEVLEVTRGRLAAAGREWHELPCRDDVDTPADLCQLVERLQSREAESQSASVEPLPERELLNGIWECLPPSLRSLSALQELRDRSGALPSRSTGGAPLRPGGELTIVGGGVIGLSIAWEAARRGLRVTVLEKKTIGEGTSWTAAGILPPANWETASDPIDQLRGLSHLLHPVWAAELKRVTGIDNGLRRCGGIYLATSVGEAAALVGLRTYWQEYDIAIQALSTAELVSLEPSLSQIVEAGRVKAAYRLPDEYQIRSPDHLTALRAACELEGVQIVESVSVDRLDEHPDQVLLETEAGQRTCEAVVVTTGAWSSSLAKKSGFPFDIIPVRGQVLLYRLPKPPFRHVVNEGNRYFVPRDDGHLLIGSSEEEVGWNTDTTTSALAEIQNWGEQTWPELKAYQPIRSWAGLRPATVDGFPYLGKVPQSRRTYVATGHFRSGIHLSCASAVLIVDALLGEPPKMDLDPFRIGRG